MLQAPATYKAPPDFKRNRTSTHDERDFGIGDANGFA
jgi:hypothetical protein